MAIIDIKEFRGTCFNEILDSIYPNYSESEKAVSQQLENTLETSKQTVKRRYLPETHFSKETREYLEKYITQACNRVEIEYPYLDWEYLSSVYSYYIKATKSTIKECYRLHLYINNEYMGYIVLRPTPYSHVGRIQASPALFLHNTAYVIANTYKSNIIGEELRIRCCQFITQDPEVAMCAQVAAWTVLENAVARGWNVTRMRTADITDQTWTFPERKIPAKGLTCNNIMEVLSSAGIYPILRGSVENRITHGEIMAYIDSGIPVIGLLKSQAHAICLIGHGKIQDVDDNMAKELFSMYAQNTSNILMSYHLISDIVVNDDNAAPYQLMPCYTCITPNSLKYTLYEIDNFIVPLCEKMYITYRDVYINTMAYIEDPQKRNKFPEKAILRIYLAEANKFKSHCRKNINMPNVQDVLCRLLMPSFVWCVEVSSIDEYSKGNVECLFVYDATRHQSDNKTSWLFIQTLEYFSYYEKDGSYGIVDITECKPYLQYRSNLEEITNV